MPYTVHFDANGSTKSVTVDEIKPGNQYLQCKADTANNDAATVAYIPFDAVLYIVHDGITVSTSSN